MPGGKLLEDLPVLRDTSDGVYRLYHVWSSVALDLLMTSIQDHATGGLMVSLSDVCKNYNITVEELRELMTIPEFVALYRKHRDEVAEYGTRAPVMLRSRMLAASLIESLYVDVMSGDGDVKDKLKLLERLSAILGYTDKESRRDKPQGSGVAGRVVVNIPAGIPGLSGVQVVASAGEVYDHE